MLERRPFAQLGGADHGWLVTKHHFSFADYHDPRRLGLGNLRVWNDDTLAPGSGFPPHPHRDMEIVTYVREGAITHKDGLGNVGRTAAGDVQVMSAGTGIVHAERNAEAVPTKLFQLWILPSRRGLAPRWATRPFPQADRAGAFVTLASGFAEDEGALHIAAQARVVGVRLAAGDVVDYPLAAAHKLYIVAASGSYQAVPVHHAGAASDAGDPGDAVAVATGDGLVVADVGQVRLTAATSAELLMVETT